MPAELVAYKIVRLNVSTLFVGASTRATPDESLSERVKSLQIRQCDHQFRGFRPGVYGFQRIGVLFPVVIAFTKAPSALSLRATEY